MGYGRRLESRKGHPYRPGLHIDQIREKYEPEKRSDEYLEDLKEREDIVKAIVELLDKGYPEEEMIINLEKQFPNMTSEVIARNVSHWQTQYESAKSEIDSLIEKIQNLRLPEAGILANKHFGMICIHYKPLRDLLETYYIKKIAQIKSKDEAEGDEER